MLDLTGYTDRMSARPGETIAFKLSSVGPDPVHARLVRVVSADPNPDGPGLIEHDLSHVFATDVPSRQQKHSVGSYAIAPSPPIPDGPITLTALVWPTRPGERQAVLTLTGETDSVSLGTGPEGAEIVLLIRGADTVIATGIALAERHWVRLWCVIDPAGGTVSVGQQLLSEVMLAHAATSSAPLAATPALGRQVLIAARSIAPLDGSFDGKIEAPTILAGTSHQASDSATLAQWDFAQDFASLTITDTGPHACHGRLVNHPARAMKGAHWDGREMSFRHAPELYGAIHFHTTDLSDCAWDTDFEFTVPADLKSGCYAMRLSCGDARDTIPFFVPPPKGTTTAPLAVLIPTFTYTVYVNYDRVDFNPAYRERCDELGFDCLFPADHPEYGLSTYNVNADGSGICHSSIHRPLLNVRPGHLAYLDYRGSGLRHYGADMHLITFLEEEGIDYDIITDHELDDEGLPAIEGYDALLTSSHPEYHTATTLDALTAYRDGGGRFAYLGGNGFYWRVARHPETPNVIEIRRGEGGIRAWASEPGEYYQAFDGHYGGLWRRSGRPPQELAGVGFSSQGPLEGSHYRLLTDANDPRVGWLVAGIDGPLFGGAGLSGGGAAGFELDRADARLGTPDHTVILARSEGHSDGFIVVHEERLTHLTNIPGEPLDDLVRADMTFFETPSGGAVFAVGSITFCGSLPERGGDPDVRQLLKNLITRFLDKTPFAMPG
ncbi:MAG: N,N-dimethylformamidase beta subunit family domain-containing protein [Pseudomonadota bacterium]